MKTVVILGAGGFIGKALTKAALVAGNKVYAMARDRETLSELFKHANLEIVELDMHDYRNIDKFLPDIYIDSVCYLSWLGGVETKNVKNNDLQIKNFEIFYEFMNAIVKVKPKKILFVSSERKAKKHISGYQDIVDSLYGSIKHSCELVGKNIAFENNILFNSAVFSHVYGPGDISFKSSSQIIAKMLKNEAVDLIDRNTLYDWCYVDDAANGLIKIMEQGLPYVSYYVGSRKVKPFGCIIDNVKNTLNSQSKLNYGIYRDDYIVDYDKLDTEKIYRDTDFRIDNNFKDKILKTANWVKNNLDLRQC